MEKAYAFWRTFQDRLVEPVAALLLIGCTLLAIVEIVRRYVFGFSYEWQSDAVIYFMLSGVFLYFAVAQRHGEHLTVTIVTETLDAVGPRARRAAEVIRLFAGCVAFVFLILLAWWGIPEVQDSMRYESRSESLAFPMWPFLTVLLVGFTFMAVTLFFQIYRSAQKLRGVSVLEEPEKQVPAVE